MSTFVAAEFEVPPSTSNLYSSSTTQLPSQFTHSAAIDHHHTTLPNSSTPSHSQLELQHQHFQAQLQLHHLQSQKQRQLQNETQNQQPQALNSSIPPLATTSVATTTSSNALNQGSTTLNFLAPASSNSTAPALFSEAEPIRSHSVATNFTAATPASTISDSTLALSPMDFLSATSFAEPSLNHIHTLQQSYVCRSIASVQSSPLPTSTQQSQVPVATEGAAIQMSQHSQHVVHSHDLGASSGSTPDTVLLGDSSSNLHQSLQHSFASNCAISATGDFIRRTHQSNSGNEMAQRLMDGPNPRVKLEHGFTAPSSGYRLDARIIQKKDQIEELSTPGYKAPSRSVEEVRTGQQFLIKLQFLRNDGSHATEFPAMRLERRSAINTSGEPASEPEELTLEIIVRLEKSGQVRRSACAKCCHKYGPSSPILLLLDPLSPSPTDPIMYSHIDIYTGSLTLLAKVVCSSTDHSERGNKDRYIFEFLVKRTSPTSSSMRSSLSPGLGEGSESGEIIASCVTTPVMCSGHHKAKRLLVDQRVEKATRAVPTPKTKVIKRRKSVEGSMSPYHLLADSDTASENMATTPVPMSLSPSTYPVTSVAPTPSMLDVQMPGHDGQPSSPASSLFPPATGAASHVSPQSPVHNPRLDEYVSVGPQNGLMSVSSATSGFPSSSTASSSPSITEIRPNQGPIRKATHVAIRGMSFREGMVPYFGCFPATEIVVETSTLMLCRVPESPLPGTVPVTICEGVSASYTNLSEFTYTDDNETELLILQLQLRMAHRALEYLHAQATGQQGTASDILRSIPGCLSPSPPANAGGSYGATTHSAQCSLSADEEGRTSHRPLTLEQVEQGLLKTIEHLPMAIDISMELEDGSNLLHLSILMGFTKLALELIQHGCEIEAYDKWGYTPLMYAVFMGQIDIVQALVQAGASASGAKTPNEFYTRLGRAIDRNDEISALLNTACERYQTEECCQWQGSPTLAPSTESAQTETQGNNHGEVECPQPSSLPLLQDAGEDERGALSPRTILSSQLADEPDPATSMKCDAVLDVSSGAEQQQQQQQQQQQESGYHSGVISEVQDRLKEMHRQQLPTTGIDMHVKLRRLESSSTMLASSASSTKVAEAVAASLGSSSGLALSPSSLSSPPSSSSLSSTMTTPSTSRTIASEVATDPFRTGDYFVFEIDLTVNTAAMADGHALPSSYLGLRFPHELVKRTSGKAPSLLDEMTYDIKCSVELGPHSATAAHGEDDMDRLKVAGACKDCNKWLHEQGRHSPSRSPAKNPDWSPVVQFGIPMPLDQHHHHYHHHQQHGSVGGVVEVHNGRCEVKARVHCSSMHHLVQREKERFMAIKRERERAMMDLQQQGSSEYDPEWKTKLQVEANRVIKNLKDPGYVFVFELVHPETHEVVATARTAPMIFRTFQRRK